MPEDKNIQQKSNEQVPFNSIPGMVTEPKAKKPSPVTAKPVTAKAATTKATTTKAVKQEPKSAIPAPQDMTKIQFFESPAQQIPKMIEEEKVKEPKDLTWLSSSFSTYKTLDTKYQNFTPENRMQIGSYSDAFKVKNSEIKRHQKVIDGIVTKTTSDLNIDDLTKIDSNGNRYLDKERLRRIVTRKVENLGGNEIVADYVFSKAAVAAENRFNLNNQKKVFETKLQTANIKKPKAAAIVEKEFKDIQLSARGEMKVAQESVKSELIKESETVNAKYVPQINNVLMQAPYPMAKAVEDAKVELSYENADYLGEREYFEGIQPRVSDAEVTERANALFQAKNQDYLTTQYLPVVGQMQAEIKALSGKYNNILKRKGSEIQSSYEKKFSEMKALYEKDASDYNAAIDKLWNEAGEDLKNQYENNMKAVYEALGAGANFTRNFVKSAGGMLNGIGSYLRMNGIDGSFVDFLASAGQDAQMYNNTYTPSVKDAYLSPKYWAGAMGEMMGSSAVIAGATIATRNPFIGGLLSNIVEGSSMAGSVYNQQILEGKDPVQASSAASEVARMNLATMPLNALQAKLFMPFTKGAGFTGAFKKVTAGALGGTLEEMGQATFEEGKGFQPQKFYAPETLEMGVRVFGAQMFMGAPGGAMSGLVQNLTTNKNNPSALAQTAARMIRENGPSRVAAVGEALNITGEINDEQTAQMKILSEAILDIENEANSIGLEGDKKDAFVGITYDIRELEKKKETVKSESAKAVIDNQISEKKKQLSNIINDKTELAAVVIAGTKVVVPVEEAAKIVGTDQFAEAAADEDVQIETTNADLTAKVEEAKQQKVRQRNIISDTGEIIEQLPAEAAPATEAAPAVLISTSELFDQMTADEKDAFTNDVLDAVASFKGVTSTNKQGEQLIQAAKEGVRKNPVGELDKAISRAEEVLNKAKAEDKGDFMSSANIEASQNALNNLNQIKQKYATKISEGPQQEVGQPSNLVQREGTQEGQPQVGQAEGAVGQAAQPAADTRNRNFGSQAQQAIEEIKAIPELSPVVQTYTSSVNPGQEVQLMDELAQQVTEGEERSVRQMGQAVVDKVKQWIADTGYTAPAVTAPSMETAPVEDIMTLDTKDETNLQKVFNFLDNIDKQLDKFGRETAGINIALPVAKLIVKALKEAVRVTNNLQEAIKKVAADFEVTEKDVIDSFKRIQEIEKTGVMAGMTDEQIKERRKQERLGKVYNTPQAQQLAETAKQDATNAKTAKLTPIKAYEAVLAKVKENIDKIYKSGNYPEGIAWINMMQVAPAIARDAVNAIFPRSQKMSAMETEMVTMSARDYMRSLVSSQISAIGQLFNNSKKMTSALKDMFKSMNETFGRGMELRTSEVSKIISEIQSVVFDKNPDLQTSMEEATRQISAIVEKGYRRKMIDEMATAIDKINARLKTKYSGDLIPKIGNIVSISPSDWDKSNATLEDINLFNTHLKQIAKGDNTKIDSALDVLNSVTITDQQKTKSEFDKLNTKLTNLNNKVKAGTIDITGLKDLIRLQKAINNIAERKGVEGAMSESQQAEIQKKFDELEKRLPKPIEQLVQDKVSEVKDNVNSRVAQMKNELIDPASGLGQKIKSNDLHYQFVRMVNNYLTDDYINNLAETNPSKLVSLLSALDDIYNDGNYNNDSYLEYVSAIKYKFQKAFSEWSDNLSKNRSKFASNGVVNAFKEVARTLTDVEGGNVSPEAIKSNLTTLRIHQYDVELTGKRDEFDMGILERDLFGPMAMHQEAAMNKTQPVIEKLRDAMILYADKSNHPVIKRAINAFGSRYGVEIDVMFGKLKELTKRGFQTRLLHDVSVRMASIVNNQIDDISNLAEGDVEIDIILQRSIIGVKTDEKGKPIYSDKTMAQYYSKPGTLKLDIEQNYNKLVNAIAYAALTNNGTTTLVGLKEQQLLDLLTPKQREGIAAWREVINQTESLTEAAMVITGNMNPLLKNYFPRRVQQEKKVTEIDDTESYLNGGFEYGGLANNMLKSRRGNVGALDLDGNKVLFNYIKSLNLLVEVKPFLDYVKGLKDAQQKAEAEGDLFAARYLKGIELFATEKLNAKLLQNEKSLNETFSTVFKNIAGVQSYTAKSYLISVVRQLALEYPLNVTKAGIAIAFANRSFPKQIWRLFSTNKLSLKTSKGKFEWSDYMKVVQFTGSQIARTMNLYADNYVYEYSKSPEQLQREQKLMGWQDTRPKKFLWMNRFENAFKRITGEDFDHKAFEDERGVYRNMYLTAVEKASFLADATVDKQYGSSSFTRDPLRVNLGMNPALGILTGTLVGGPVGTTVAVGYGAAGGFLSRGVRNLLNRIFKTDRALFTIKKDNEAALVTGFLQGYAGVQHASFISDMKRAMSLNSGETFKKRAELFSRGILESLLPSVGYVITRTYTGLIFTTATAVILGIGDDEDKEEVKKNALNPDWWERQLYKIKKKFKQQKERIINDLAAGTTSVILDPQSAFLIKMAGGLAMFKLWKEDAIEKMGEKGVKKDQINEMKKNIKNIENIWFDIYNIRPIDIIHGEAYEKALDRYYSASEPTKDWEETAMTITSYQEIIQTIQFAKTWEELRKNAVENKDIDKDELYSAAVLKAYSILFTLNVLGGKYGYLLSMLTGDARKVSNTMLKDLEAQQLEYEIKNKDNKRGSGGLGGGGLSSGGLGGGGLGGGGLR